MDERDGVRVASEADAGGIAQLLHDFNTEFDVATPGPAVLADRLRHLLSATPTFAVIADSPPVGVALVTPRPNVWYEGTVATLDELYVVPRLRGDGIGSAMMRRVIEHASATGVEAIEINVDEGDVEARRFYERHGFSSVEPDTKERAFYYFMDLAP